MKQQATQEQWDELTRRQKLKFWNFSDGVARLVPDIGQMIEFLEDDINDFIFHPGGGWTIILKEEYYNEELCDSLWEATKYKLK